MATDDSGLVIWERVEGAERATRLALDHRRIGLTAVQIADADGLDAVSMRRLAGELGVATMALYRYVTSKEDVFWLMVDSTLADTADPGDDADWRDVVHSHAVGARRVILRHPWLVEVGARVAIGLTPSRMAVAERILRSFDELGLDADDRMAVLGTVNSYVWGSTGNEVAMGQLMRRHGWSTGDDLRSAYSPHVRWLMGTGRFPIFQRSITEVTRKDDADWRFQFGLDCVIEGIAARLGI